MTGPLFLSQVSYRVRVALVLALSGCIALSGLGVKPLDAHEVFVVQTAKEMSSRNEWVVPYFNETLRLNKPPLSYWLTEICSSVLPGNFEPLDGRLPSALAAIGLVALTIWIGRLLYCRSVSLMAGLIATTTLEVAHFSHDSRPDMLYAFLCTLMLALFVRAWRGSSGWRMRLTEGPRLDELASREDGQSKPKLGAGWIYCMWATMALATLAKGPHIPAIFLGAFVLTLTLGKRSLFQSIRALRPFTGVLLWVAIALPWWLLLRLRVGSETLASSQLTGSRYELSLWQFVDPFYWYTTLLLGLPWLILLPSTLWIARKRKGGHATGFLLLLVLTTILALSFGGSKRGHYVLVLTSPLALLMAIGARALYQSLASRNPQGFGWRRLLIPVQALLLAAGFFVLSKVNAREGLSIAQERTHQIFSIAIVGLAACLIAFGWTRRSKAPSTWRSEIVALAVLISSIYVSSNITGLMNSPLDWQRAKMSTLVGRTVGPDDQVFVFDAGGSTIPYYAGVPFTRPDTIEALSQRIAGLEGEARALIVMSMDRYDELAELHPIEEIGVVEGCKKSGPAWALVTAKRETPRADGS